MKLVVKRTIKEVNSDYQKDSKTQCKYPQVSREGIRHEDNRENLSSFSYTGSQHYK